MIYKKYKVTCSVKLNKYQKYDAYLLDRARYIRQKSVGHVYRSRPVVGQSLSGYDVEVSVCQVLCCWSLLLLSNGPKRIN